MADTPKAKTEIAAGMRFRADKGLLELFPDDPVWEISRPLAIKTQFLDNQPPIDNHRQNKWWANPVGWRGQFEMICVFEQVDYGQLFRPEELPCEIDSMANAKP